MKIAILGQHPDLYPGFNALMSANFCYGFSRAGHDVTLLLTETSPRSQRARLEQLKVTLNDLDDFEAASVEMRIIDKETQLERFDLIVWQSYFAEDEVFWPEIRRAARVVTKNFPRLLTGELQRDANAFQGATGKFDIVGMSLQSDCDIAAALFSETHAESLSRCIYQPRGFRQDWMLPDDNYDGYPVFGIERGVGTNGEDYAYLIPVLEELRRRYGHIEVIGARFDDPRLTTKRINLLTAREFYRQFIAPLWGYLMIDIDTSRQSMNAVTVNGRKIYPGMYENQIVEAQLAGAAVIGHEDALPSELVASNATGLRFQKYESTDEILDFLGKVIENRENVKNEAREWAEKYHSIESMVNPIMRFML